MERPLSGNRPSSGRAAIDTPDAFQLEGATYASRANTRRVGRSLGDPGSQNHASPLTSPHFKARSSHPRSEEFFSARATEADRLSVHAERRSQTCPGTCAPRGKFELGLSWLGSAGSFKTERWSDHIHPVSVEELMQRLYLFLGVSLVDHLLQRWQKILR